MSFPDCLSLIWPGTKETIPANWARTTIVDGRFPFITPEDDAGESSSKVEHDHEVTCLGHDMSALASSGFHNNASVVVAADAPDEHGHETVKSHPATVLSVATANTEPRHIKVIFIHPANSIPTGAPPGAWGFRGNTSSTGWAIPDASAGDVYLRGAAADADSNLVPSRIVPPQHGHTVTHGHEATDSGGLTLEPDTFSAHGVGNAAADHVHPVILGDVTQTVLSAVSEPAYQKVAIVENQTGIEDLPDGLRALYFGLYADRPPNWNRIDFAPGHDLIMGASTLDDVGDVGGYRGHDHQLTTPHTHPPSAGPGSTETLFGDDGGDVAAAADHDHEWTVGLALAVVATSADYDDYPPWLKAIMLEYTTPPPGVVAGTAEGSCEVSGTVAGLGAIVGNATGSADVSGTVSGCGRVAGTAAGSADVRGTVGIGHVAPRDSDWYGMAGDVVDSDDGLVDYGFCE